VLLAQWVTWTGSYSGMFVALSLVVSVAAMLAFYVPIPTRTAGD
jgi:hypothetical protein